MDTNRTLFAVDWTPLDGTDVRVRVWSPVDDSNRSASRVWPDAALDGGDADNAALADWIGDAIADLLAGQNVRTDARTDWTVD